MIRSYVSPLIAHIVFRFDTGGLENGLANLINAMPVSAARHVVIALTEVTDFASRIARDDVELIALHKRPGKDPRAYLRLYRLLRKLRPDIVHTRNVGTLDCQVVAWAAGVKHRVHGEHGWDVRDPDGTNARYRWVRRALRPFVHRFVALSGDIETYLHDAVGVPARHIARICNGVDTSRFHPQGWEAEHGRGFTIGTVTRFSDIKDPLNTVDAFIELKRRLGTANEVRLLMVGDGPLRDPARRRITDAGLEQAAEFPGNANDPAPWYQKMDLFVLGSRAEGISNTVLEALASGLPVVATRVGGNVELVEEGVTGTLIPPSDPVALATAMELYVRDRNLTRRHGQAARCRATRLFSLGTMIERYRKLYEEVA